MEPPAGKILSQHLLKRTTPLPLPEGEPVGAAGHRCHLAHPLACLQVVVACHVAAHLQVNLGENLDSKAAGLLREACRILRPWALWDLTQVDLAVLHPLAVWQGWLG